MLSNFFRSSHLFFYVGFALIFLALVFLPVKVKVGGTPEQVDVDYYSMGWLHAPAIGSYGLACLVLGILEVAVSKKWSLSIFESIFLIPILILICLWTLFIVFISISFGNFNVPFWWFAFIFYVVPIITVALGLFLGVKKKEYLVRVLGKKSIKIAVSIIMIAFPLIYTAIVLQSAVLVWACWFP